MVLITTATINNTHDSVYGAIIVVYYWLKTRLLMHITKLMLASDPSV